MTLEEFIEKAYDGTLTLEDIVQFRESGGDIDGAVVIEGLHSPTISEDPAIVAATKGNKIETVRLLLEQGANVNARSSEYSLTALQFACHSGRGRYEIASLLLDQEGCNPSLASSPTNHDALHILLRIEGHEKPPVELVEKMIRVGRMDVNKKISSPLSDQSYLASACEHGCLDIVKLLISLGATDLNNSLYQATRAPHLYTRNPEIVKLLLEQGANPNHESLLVTQTPLLQSVLSLDIDKQEEEKSSNNIKIAELLMGTGGDLFFQSAIFADKTTPIEKLFSKRTLLNNDQKRSEVIEDFCTIFANVFASKAQNMLIQERSDAQVPNLSYDNAHDITHSLAVKCLSSCPPDYESLKNFVWTINHLPDAPQQQSSEALEKPRSFVEAAMAGKFADIGSRGGHKEI